MSRTFGEMVDAGEPISAVFDAVVMLHRALKAEPIKGRIWRYTWTHDGRACAVAMSGYLTETVDHLPPLNCMIEVDGWLRVLTDPFNGTIVGPSDTETMVLNAIDGEVKRIQLAVGGSDA